MNKVLLIACQLLKIRNEDIDYIIREFNDKQMTEFFNGDYDLLFHHNLIKYEQQLNDKEKLQTVINKAKKLHKLNLKHNIKMITCIDTNYPQNMKMLKMPAPIIYIQGSTFKFEELRTIGCVGTRKPSDFGRKMTKQLVEEWVKDGGVVVSGLATGIDSISHEIAVKNKAQTIAVLAHGLDSIYPKENGGLATNIIDSGGCLISEYVIGTKPAKHHFINRNRIVAALSKVLVVFEAEEKSGTMHTVRFAEELGRPIFIPSLEWEDNNCGSANVLLNSGRALRMKTKIDYQLLKKYL